MKNKNAVMIRYTGCDARRTYLLQRGDFAYWTGSGWSKILDNAKVFRNHRAAGVACAAIRYQQYKNKPIRTFRVELNITLVADDVASIRQEALVKYVSEALRLEVENSIHGDGPVKGSFVEARLNILSLEETKPRRTLF